MRSWGGCDVVALVLDPWFLSHHFSSSPSPTPTPTPTLRCRRLRSPPRFNRARPDHPPAPPSMMTMSDDGDRTCPLCAEEMDVTDQQLKPCKCGYEICVWCWHHIMEMAEKEETEGRCPACRTRYDKDRIVKMAASCERMVAEINAEKKQKTQKVKAKAATVEAKKHLASVRVIQRNLVYIIGLPANLCDESILERREYFGQYGRVLKVSVSRPTGAASQQASTNNTLSVYITYAREEEAVRCIQAVHNFVLEGKVLRACFGTTKYCHAWLRNMTCGNPDCLYLHDVGSQEDSFTKDEIISAYTRSRVPQMASCVSQKRAGTLLPPPADDFSYSAVVSAKHTVKNGATNTTSQAKLSPPNSNSRKSTLPAAASWGLRNLSSKPTASGVTSSQSLTNSKSESHGNSVLSSSMVSSTRQPSAWNDDTSTAPKMSEGRQVSERDSTCKTSKPYKPGISKETQSIASSESSIDIDFSRIPSAWSDDEVVTSKGSDEKKTGNGNGKPVCSVSSVSSKGSEEKQVGDGNGKPTCLVSSKPIEAGHLPSKSSASPKKDTVVYGTGQSYSDCFSSTVMSTDVNSSNSNHQISNTTPNKCPTLKVINNQSGATAAEEIREGFRPVESNIQKLSVGLSSLALDNNHGVQSLAGNQQQNATSDTSTAVLSSQDLKMEQSHPKLTELLSSDNADKLTSGQPTPDKHFDWSSDVQSQVVVPPLNGVENSSLASHKCDVGMLDVADKASSSSYLHSFNTSYVSSWNGTESEHAFTSNTRTSDSMMQTRLFSSRDSTSTLSNGHHEELGTTYTPGNGFGHPGMESHRHQAINVVRNDNVASFDKAASVNKDESSIISDILSLEFDPWDESYSSANNFVKMLGESEKNDMLFNVSSSWKSKTSNNESRFSFARQDSQGNLTESSLRNSGHEQNFNSLSQNSHGTIYQNGRTFQSLEVPDEFSKSNSLPTLEKTTTGISRSKVFAPPGFSAPSRVPPPGFSSAISSQDRSNQVYDSYSESHLLNHVSGNANHYQPQLIRNSSDIEFIDPAILAVGKGRMPAVSDSGLEPKHVSAFPSQFHASNTDPRLQLLMQQQSISSHQNLRLTDHIGNAFMPMNDNYLASRLLSQNHGSLPPYAQMPRQQLGNPHLTNGQWDGWSDTRLGNNIPMSDLLRILYPSSEENSFHMPSTNGLYNRAFGL